MAQPLGLPVEIGALAGDAQMLGPHLHALGGIAGDHAARVADQKGMDVLVKVGDSHRAFHMMRHLFLVPDWARFGGRTVLGAGHAGPVTIHRCHHRIFHRLVVAGVA